MDFLPGHKDAILANEKKISSMVREISEKVKNVTALDTFQRYNSKPHFKYPKLQPTLNSNKNAAYTKLSEYDLDKFRNVANKSSCKSEPEKTVELEEVKDENDKCCNSGGEANEKVNGTAEDEDGSEKTDSFESTFDDVKSTEKNYFSFSEEEEENSKNELEHRRRTSVIDSTAFLGMNSGRRERKRNPDHSEESSSKECAIRKNWLGCRPKTTCIRKFGQKQRRKPLRARVTQKVMEGVNLMHSQVQGSVIGTVKLVVGAKNGNCGSTSKCCCGNLKNAGDTPVTSCPRTLEDNTELFRNILRSISEEKIAESSEPDLKSKQALNSFKEDNPCLNKYFKNRPESEVFQDTDSPQGSSSQVNSCTKPTCFRQISEKLISEETLSKKKVAQLLDCFLRNKYWDIESWRRAIPKALDLTQTPEGYLFDFNMVVDRKKLPKKMTFNNHIISHENSWRKVLVQANPRFGKTLLCKLLAFHWCCSDFPIKKFKFCFLLSLGEVNVTGSTNFTNVIVEEILECLKGFHVEKDVVEKLLRMRNKDIVLLLDDYDKLSEIGRRELLNFLKYSELFEQSTIVMTTRPGADPMIYKVFDALVDIRGFSVERLRDMMSIERASDKHLRRLKDFLSRNPHLCQLSGLSPRFSWFIHNLFMNSEFLSKMDFSLYQILETTLILSLNHDTKKVRAVRRQTTANDVLPQEIKTPIVNIGKLFLEALNRGSNVFTQTDLERAAEFWFQDLSQSMLFYEERENGGYCWAVSDRAWQVLLSTMFLREGSDDCDEEQREDFIKRALCLSESDGRYIMSNTGGPGVYFVGSTSDIVVSLGPRTQWKKCTPEMSYDVDINIDFTP